ncbi:MAG: alpha-2-macroglobulin [Tannerellaceae bacterium]|jgi:hypothetical protein|nr:alpha-2-macroglobulin [Tannerellaceae bacterium]
MKKNAIVAALCLAGIMTTVLCHAVATGQLDEQSRLKTLIAEMKVALESDRDSFPALIARADALRGTVKDVAAVALLHSMSAELYHIYYLQNRPAIDRRTPVEGFVPQDIRLWTPNLFDRKIKEELAASLLQADLLQRTPASDFAQVLSPGKDSPSLRPTLYDFLAHRALEMQPSEKVYRDLLNFRRSRPGEAKAAMVAELDYLRYRYNLYEAEGQAAYEAALDSLLDVSRGEDYSVEVVYARLELLQRKRYEAGEDSIRHIEYNLCRDALARFPNYERIALVSGHLASLEQQRISLESSRTVYPGKDLSLKIRYNNVEEARLRIYKSGRRIEETASAAGRPGNRPVRDVSLRLRPLNSFTPCDTVLSVAGIDGPGLYDYVVSTEGSSPLSVKGSFSVSGLAAVTRPTPQGEVEALVTDYLSGRPLGDVAVNYYGGSSGALRLTGTVKTDANGLALIPVAEAGGVYACQPWTETDGMSPLVMISGGRRAPAGRVVTEVSLFTDRGVYRPGQTVFFKGIAYVNDSDDPRVASGESFVVVLRDADYREVATKSLTSNAFGSFSGEFVLPARTLTGWFTLSAANASVSIAVEEYKRPTFRVNLPGVKDEVAFGDEVTIRGDAQTFSGAPLTEGTVTYRIVRRPFMLRHAYGTFREEQVAAGTAPLAGDGSFSFAFRPEKDNSIPYASYQSYDIIAQVTDSKGETQETTLNFAVGDSSIVLSAPFGGRVDKDTTVITIAARTLSGEAVTVGGTYAFALLEDTGREGEYREVRELVKGSFTSGVPLSRDLLRQIPSGRIRLSLSSADNRGRRVDDRYDFILYSRNDPAPPVFSHTWLLTGKNECLPGEEAELYFGSSDSDVYLLMEVFADGKNVVRRRVELSRENRSFRVPMLESYGDGMTASFTFVKEGRLYTEQTTIMRRRPGRTLTVKPESFRDRLLPGSHESIRFRISDAAALPVAGAEVLAGMYDASLDRIRPFAWRFSPVRYNVPYYGRFMPSEGLGSWYGSDVAPVNSRWGASAFAYDRLDWQGALDLPRRSSAYLAMARSADMASAPAGAAVLQESMTVMQKNSPPEEVPEAQPVAAAPLRLRADFNETAFFFPSLFAGEDGSVAVDFTLPESNTTWKLQALAHTADLKYGMSTIELVTQKPLMTLPNLPRFIRRGDEVHLSAQIINLSDAGTSGAARLEVFNPEDESPIISPQVQSFTLPAGGSATVSWTVTISDAAAGPAGFRIVAESEAGSDGEQHLLPVLPDEMLVTGSAPFYLSGETEKQIQAGQVRPHRMTLELSNNPVWYAVQALPAVAEPRNDDVVSWFASYYVRTLAAHIANSSPRIRRAIEQWQAQKGTDASAATLLSSLERNEELKAIMLDETPWMLDAKTESEQKQQLGMLFDINRTSYLREAAMRELIGRQREDGGWEWFRGLYPSPGITLHILEGMAQLSGLGAVQYSRQEKEMQAKAVRYMDKIISEEYEALRKSKGSTDSYVPTPLQLQYLYVRSSYSDIPQAGAVGEAIRFYTAQAARQWTKVSLYEKGDIALLMHRNGNNRVAREILSWLRRTATTSPEQGMYWANNSSGQNSLLSPIAVHSLLMSVFGTLGADAGEINLLKQWLLSRKQTQNWGPAPSTVNAVYSLLSDGSDWLADANSTTVRWGDKTLNVSSVGGEGEMATGYVKETIEGKDITPAMHTVTLRKEGKAPAWGAVYYQYFAPISMVSQQGGALSVEKKLFVETNSGSQRQIVPVDTLRPLRVGDRVIVRLTIRADRDMEYVSLKDLRPGCFEPAVQRSGVMSVDRLLCYHSPKDVSENFFFDRLPRGTYVMEYAAYVSRSGRYSGGAATLQCLYAPEFVSYTEGNIIFVHE